MGLRGSSRVVENQLEKGMEMKRKLGLFGGLNGL